MAINFKVPSSPTKSIFQINTFLGCDYTNSPANVSETKSPNCLNMIRDVPGKVRKCMGWHTIKTYDGKINGAHYLRASDVMIIHSGTKLYIDDEVVYSDMNDARSKSWQFGDNLFIQDGKALVKYSQTTKDGTTTRTVVKASDAAYTPKVTISKDPSGGGKSYEDLNLINPAFIETFVVTDEHKTETAFHLSFKGLDSTACIVKVMNSDGDFVQKVEGTDYTVDRTNGIINFTSAPGKSPVSGEDNVSIQAYRTVSGYSDKINKCTIGTLFGVKGNTDRLFVSGNPDYINYDWYSQQYDPTYFPDTAYSVLGSSSSAIIGYSTVSNYLAAHKDDKERDQNIILREGDLEDSKPSFPIIAMLQGAGAVAPWSFAYLSTEPIFLTKAGVFAVTAQDITGEKYAQNRSYYVNGKLLEEADLKNAYACVYNSMYWLCLNDKCYMLDGLQPMQTDKSMPYATRQYACFYRENVPANCMWTFNEELYFGTSTGKVCKFYKDKKALASYNDDGEAIPCQWETPDLDGKLFFKNKTFRYIAVRLDSAIATSIQFWAMKHGFWFKIKEDDTKGRYLMFSELVFSKFTFSCDQTQKVLHTKTRIKKVDKARFRFSNDHVNEPFGLFDIALEFVENGNYKG